MFFECLDKLAEELHIIRTKRTSWITMQYSLIIPVTGESSALFCTTWVLPLNAVGCHPLKTETKCETSGGRNHYTRNDSHKLRESFYLLCCWGTSALTREAVFLPIVTRCQADVLPERPRKISQRLETATLCYLRHGQVRSGQ